MTVLYVCDIHGKLTAEHVVKKGKYNGIQGYRCKECYRKMRQGLYKINREKILAKVNARRKADPEKYREIKRKSRIKNAHKHMERERIRSRKSGRKACRELHDWYVKKVLTKRTMLKNGDLPKELVDLKRSIIKINRKIRNFNEEIKHEKAR